MDVQKIVHLDYYVNMRLKTEVFRNFTEYPNQMKTILQFEIISSFSNNNNNYSLTF